MAAEGTRARLCVGSSGFAYPSWRAQGERQGTQGAKCAKGGFYPADARPEDFLRLYAERLGAVELNNTFYRLPAQERFERWAEATPPGFRFAVKMPRSITFWGRLEEVGTFCERVRALGNRLGPILVRLHDTRPRDDGFLGLLLDSVDPDLSVALDLRDPSWDGIEAFLAQWPAALRVNALAGPAPLRYLRLRDTPYDDSALRSWAARIRALLDEEITVYCFFKHEEAPTAPAYAARLTELVHGAQALRGP